MYTSRFDEANRESSKPGDVLWTIAGAYPTAVFIVIPMCLSGKDAQAEIFLTGSDFCDVGRSLARSYQHRQFCGKAGARRQGVMADGYGATFDVVAFV